MRVNPGELSKRIEIVRRETTEDADGYAVEAKRTLHKCWAKVSRTSGTELIRANASFKDISIRFLIRHTKTGITRRDTVLYAGGEYQIEYLNDYNDAHEYLEIYGRLLSLEG